MGKFQLTRLPWFNLILLVMLVSIAGISGYRGLIAHFLNVRDSSSTTRPESSIHRLHNAALDIEKPALYNVVFFLSKDCPLCNNYKPLLDTLHAIYGQDPRFLLVGLRTDVSVASDSSYFLPVEYTAGKDVAYIARIYGAKVTPEVFVIDSNNRVLYSGAIDNWAYDTGKKRTNATENYLKDVLFAIKRGQKLPYTQTRVVGCFIE